jgi:predicted nuclease of predicted toxin-antitoxin system
VKLLFDENLSHKLVRALEDLFPGSEHARTLGLKAADDRLIWEQAKRDDLSIVSKDSDFYQRSLLFGHPPKVIWIRRGNCSTVAVEAILRMHFQDVKVSMKMHTNHFSYCCKTGI